MTEANETSRWSEIEHLAEGGHWPEFLQAIRDSADALLADVPALHMVYRLGKVADADAVGPDFRALVVAILRNATLEPWLPYFWVALVARGLVPRFWLGDYGVYEPYVVDPGSTLHELGPDVTLVYVDPEELGGDACMLADAGVYEALRARLTQLVDLVSARVGGELVISNLTPPPDAVSSTYSSQITTSWASVRRRLNVDLLERAALDASVHILDLDEVASRFGASGARDARTYYTSHVPFNGAFMPAVATAAAAVVAPIFVQPRKCVVVDCDNTLWGGVLGEDGPEGVQLGGGYPGDMYRRFQLFLRGLRDQGFLLAVNSKNNEPDVVEFMASSSDMVLREVDFAARRINWSDKAGNLRELAAELNIGLDSLLFIDDSEVECDLVRSLVPEVQVELFPTQPIEIPGFIERLTGVEVVRVTEDDLKRSESIRSNVQRERLKRTATDLDGFIRSLEIRLTIRAQAAELVGRVSQLTQRTNQFNLTTRRYTVEEVQRLIEQGLVFTLGMQDRFSDYGTVGVAIVTGSGEVADFDTLLMSCRAFGREIERAFMGSILEDLARRGFSRATGRYVPTRKNPMVADFFERCGFIAVDSDGEGEGDRFSLDLTAAERTFDLTRYTIDTGGLA